MIGPLLLALLLTPAPEASSSDYQRAYEQAFREAYRVKGIEACVASATEAASAGIDPTPICACATDKLLSTKSVGQLSQAPLRTEMDEIVMECVKSHFRAKKRAAEANP